MMLALTVLAFTLLAAAPALADVSTGAVLNQANQGDVVATNQATQEADQRQFAPGGDAQAFVDEEDVEEDNETLNVVLFEDPYNDGGWLFNNGNGYDDGYDDDLTVILEGDDEFDIDVDQEGGAGGTQDITQRQTQNATATGATFDATQLLY